MFSIAGSVMKLAASLLGGVGIVRVGFPVTPEAENAGVELSQEFALAARGIYSDCFCQTSTRLLLGSLVSTGDSGKMRVFSTGQGVSGWRLTASYPL